VDTLFLPGVPQQDIEALLRSAPGNELDSGKLANPASSSALAVNAFGWFLNKPHQLPLFGREREFGAPKRITVEAEMRFPWSGGKHPWLDAAIWTETHLIGVEAKRYEPFRGRKAVKLSVAYDRPVWGDNMRAFEKVRDDLRSKALNYAHLDAVQLVKHAFGLVTQGKRQMLKPVLVYLYAEPRELGFKPIKISKLEKHRAEIEDFGKRIEGDEVSFIALSYEELLCLWGNGSDEVSTHARNVIDNYDIG
jgi:hypothetical protein